MSLVHACFCEWGASPLGARAFNVDKRYILGVGKLLDVDSF